MLPRPLLSVLLLATAAWGQGTDRPQPQSFRVEWQPRAGLWARPGVEGYVYNESAYRVGNVRLRVQLLDASERVLEERFAWIYGDIGAGSRGYFVLPAPGAGRTYRIAVESFDLISRQAP